MNVEAFKQLLRVLKTVAGDEKKRAAFSLHDWVAEGIPGDMYCEVKDMLTIPHNCNTTACACGYAGLDTWFRNQGFITTSSGNIYYGGENAEFYSWEAVQEFFNITEDDAFNLFVHDSYKEWGISDEEYEADVTIEEVIERVEKFVKENT